MTFGAQGKWSFRGCNSSNGMGTVAASKMSRRRVLGGAAAVALSGLTLLSAPAQAPAKPALGDASCAAMKALAQEHSNDMARRNSMDHDGFFERRVPRGAKAENVMAGVKTEREAMAAWRASPPHAANMALPGCKGVAHACNKDGRCFWTMEIGRYRGH